MVSLVLRFIFIILIFKAVSKTDPAVSAEYEINSVAKDKRWGKYMNGQTFLVFL